MRFQAGEWLKGGKCHPPATLSGRLAVGVESLPDAVLAEGQGVTRDALVHTL